MTRERLEIRARQYHTALFCKLIRSEVPSEDEYRTVIAMYHRLEAAMKAQPGSPDYLPPDPDPEVRRVLYRAQLNYCDAKCFGRIPALPELPLPPIGTHLEASLRMVRS